MGNLATPKSVQKLQTALHAKAKAEAGYRFYALYDKISRDDILAHAYDQCRSNKGAPGIDRQDFAAIEAYGVERLSATSGLGRWFLPRARTRVSDGKLEAARVSTDRSMISSNRYRKQMLQTLACAPVVRAETGLRAERVPFQTRERASSHRT